VEAFPFLDPSYLVPCDVEAFPFLDPSYLVPCDVEAFPFLVPSYLVFPFHIRHTFFFYLLIFVFSSFIVLF
jgi:hypothetical protein